MSLCFFNNREVDTSVCQNCASASLCTEMKGVALRDFSEIPEVHIS